MDLKLVNSGSTWTLTDTTDTVETYTAGASGEALLTTIAARNGYTQTLQYNASNQLVSVTDSYNRSLTLRLSERPLADSDDAGRPDPHLRLFLKRRHSGRARPARLRGLFHNSADKPVIPLRKLRAALRAHRDHRRGRQPLRHLDV